MWPWRVKMLTQNLLRLLLLLILMLRKRVDDSLVQIWKLKFGHKVKYVFRFWVQSLARSSKFRQYFEAEVCSVFCCWCFLRLWSLILVESQTVGLVKILNYKFSPCLVEILKLMFVRYSEDEIWSRFVKELVIWTQPSISRTSLKSRRVKYEIHSSKQPLAAKIWGDNILPNVIMTCTTCEWIPVLDYNKLRHFCLWANNCRCR